MKKSVICAFVMVLGSTPLVWGAFDEGFEDGDAAGWSRLSGPALTVTGATSYSGSYSAQMAAGAYGAGGYLHGTPALSGNDLLFSFAMNWSSQSVLSVGKTSNVWVLYNYDGKTIGAGMGTDTPSADGSSVYLLAFGNSERTVIGDVTPDQWYLFEAYLDVANGTVDYYVDGDLLWDDVAVGPRIWQNQGDDTMSFGGGGDMYTVAMFDDFHVGEVAAVPIPGAALLGLLGIACSRRVLGRIKS